MEQPWLRSLSEDWNSEPRSSSSTAHTCGNVPSSERSSLDKRRLSSRIPRPSICPNMQASSSVGSRLTFQSTSASKGILSERTSSDLNISHGCTGLSRKAKPIYAYPVARRNPTSSSHACLQCETVAGKAFRNSQSNGRGLEDTPEWRKRVMTHNGLTQLKNLFSPNGLESMFQKPPKSPRDQAINNQKLLSFSIPSDLDNLASNTPLWPTTRQDFVDLRYDDGAEWSNGQLGRLNEVVEDEVWTPTLTSKNTAESSYAGKSFVYPVSMEKTATMHHVQIQAPREHQTPLQLDGSDDQPSKLIDRGISYPDGSLSRSACSSRRRSEHLRQADLFKLSSDPISWSCGDFSPVYISKHNTLDGKVDYMAIDPDEAQILQRSTGLQMKELNYQVQPSDTGSGPEDAKSTTCETPSQNLQLADATLTSHMAPLTDYMRTARCGHFDDISFTQRSLSPSTPTPTVPFDCVSQSHEHHSQSSSLPKYAHSSARSDLKIHSDTGFIANQALQRMRHSYSDVTAASTSIETVLRRPRSYPDLKLPTSISNTAPATLGGDVRQRSGSPDTAFSGSRIIFRKHEHQQTKRPASTQSKQPRPKRRRTLALDEVLSPTGKHIAVVEAQHHQYHNIEGDFDRYRDTRKSPHAFLEIDQCFILRPTNPTPEHSRDTKQYSGYATNISRPCICHSNNEQDHVGEMHSTGTGHSVHSPAAASDMAAIRLNAVKVFDGGIRKQSVSTQDYVDEAMKIMEGIRSRRQNNGELTNLCEAEADWSNGDAIEGVLDLTPQTVSRPPSREGITNAWRTRAEKSLDPRILSHLRKYEESTADDSFKVASVLSSFNLVNEMEADQSGRGHVTGESLNTWSTQNPELHNRRHSDSMVSTLTTGTKSIQSLHRTQSANRSTDSTGNTINTNLSQRTRTLPVITPHKVSHLIQLEEAGMRFDVAKQVWVKCRKINNNHTTTQIQRISSSMGTEDDPLAEIPDLSVGDCRRLQQINSFSDKGYVKDRLSDLEDTRNDSVKSNDEARLALSEIPGLNSMREPCLSTSSSELRVSKLRSAMPPIDTYTTSLAEDDLGTRDISMYATSGNKTQQDGPSEYSAQGPEEMTGAARPAKPLSHTSINDQGEISYVPSSPPMLAQLRVDLLRSPHTEEPCLPEPQGAFDNELRSAYYSDPKPYSRTSAQSYTRSSLGRPIPFHNQMCNRVFSLSRIDENHEVSIIATRYDERCRSLTLSISTPLPIARTLSMPLPLSSGTKHALLPSMSPLSDFSLHQDDAHHLQSRRLLKCGQQVTMRGTDFRTSPLLVDDLIKNITDAEPDEPYWDWMRALNLKNKNLSSVNMLDEFCPRIEELDLSNNKLTQMSGVPSAIRQLKIQLNSLTSLTTWGHLKNLQYLDVSWNQIDNLKAFSGLTHLRELTADENDIASLDGILDLDGLITLSLKGNRLKGVDFQGAELTRLETLYISSNMLKSVEGLQCLPALVTLDMSDNELLALPATNAKPVRKLHTLSVCGNDMTHVDVSWFPSLHLLHADENSLQSIKGVSSLAHLETLSLRDQACSITASFDDYSEVRRLHLSGNNLPHFPITTPFLNLQVLEMSLSGLQSLPADIGSLMPNLRTLNLNLNALRSLRPLRGIMKLRRLYLAGNRVSRLRKSIVEMERFRHLQELDLRENPLTVGFYAPSSMSAPISQQVACSEQHTRSAPERDGEDLAVQHLLGERDEDTDAQYVSRLDADTRLRRRVYEMLLATKCPRLDVVDGLQFQRKKLLTKDEVWEKLVCSGVLERLQVKTSSGE